MPCSVLGQALRNWAIRELTQFQAPAALITWWSVITEMECLAEGGWSSARVPAKEWQVEMLQARFTGEKSPLKFMIHSTCWFPKKGGKGTGIHWAPTLRQTLCWKYDTCYVVQLVWSSLWPCDGLIYAICSWGEYVRIVVVECQRTRSKSLDSLLQKSHSF